MAGMVAQANENMVHVTYDKDDFSDMYFALGIVLQIQCNFGTGIFGITKLKAVKATNSDNSSTIMACQFVSSFI